ncbi:MAG: DUF5606 domain-containing protein [Flammeovirgaceae bacterium]
MTLKEIAAVAGKPGLYKVIKPTHSGMIVEFIGDKPKKMVVNATHRVSILNEISIYTTDAEESVELDKVFRSIREKFGEECNPGKGADELADFLAEVLPNYDRDKVYQSDIKKLVSWYNLLSQHLPEVFDAQEEEEEPKEDEETAATDKEAEA